MMMRKKYSFWSLLVLGFCATIGSSVLISFNQVGSTVNFNPYFMIGAWVIGGILIIPEMLVMGEVAINCPENGTVYSWLKKLKWHAVAFWFGWIMILMVGASAIGSACLAVGDLLASLLNISNQWEAKGLGVAILVVLILSHFLWKNSQIHTQFIFAVLKVVLILVIIIATFIAGTAKSFNDPAISTNLHQLYLSSFALVPASAMTMFAYSGIESITYVSGEVKNPRRNIFWALITTTLIVVVLYLILVIALLLLSTPDHWKGSTNPWMAAMLSNGKLPKALAYVFSGLCLLLYIGSLNSFLIYHSRIVVRMSEAGDLFAWFRRTTKRTDVPWTAIILLFLIASCYIWWDNLNNVVNYFVLGISLLKIICVAAMWQIRRKEKDYKPIFNYFWFITFLIVSIISALISIAGILIGMYLIDIHYLYNALIVVGVMVIGFPIYYLSYLVKKLINRKAAINI